VPVAGHVVEESLHEKVGEARGGELVCILESFVCTVATSLKDEEEEKKEEYE
jgi:hypothetical protein